MFEKLTNGLRLAIDLARLEALKCNNGYIEPEHLLSNIIRDNKELFSFFLRGTGIRVIEEIFWLQLYKDIGKLVMGLEKEKTKTSVVEVIPLAARSKSLLAGAAETSETLGHNHIGIEHILMAMLEVSVTPKPKYVEILNRSGITTEALKKKFPKKPVAAKDVW